MPTRMVQLDRAISSLIWLPFSGVRRGESDEPRTRRPGRPDPARDAVVTCGLRAAGARLRPEDRAGYGRTTGNVSPRRLSVEWSGAARSRPSSRNTPEARFAPDSPLGGTGFEPSVPRGKGPTLRVSVLFHSDFSVGGEPTRGDIESLVVSRGTDGSNPVPSAGESVFRLDRSAHGAAGRSTGWP